MAAKRILVFVQVIAILGGIVSGKPAEHIEQMQAAAAGAPGQIHGHAMDAMNHGAGMLPGQLHQIPQQIPGMNSHQPSGLSAVPVNLIDLNENLSGHMHDSAMGMNTMITDFNEKNLPGPLGTFAGFGGKMTNNMLTTSKQTTNKVFGQTKGLFGGGGGGGIGIPFFGGNSRQGSMNMNIQENHKAVSQHLEAAAQSTSVPTSISIP